MSALKSGTEKLSFAEVKLKVGDHLRTAVGAERFEITFAKLEADVWRVNVEFPKKVGSTELPSSALLTIDAITGEVREFQQGVMWRF